MRGWGPAVELIWWNHETASHRWTYRRPGFATGGEAWTWELAEQRLARARTQTSPRLPARLHPARVDLPRMQLGRGPQG